MSENSLKHCICVIESIIKTARAKHKAALKARDKTLIVYGSGRIDALEGTLALLRAEEEDRADLGPNEKPTPSRRPTGPENEAVSKGGTTREKLSDDSVSAAEAAEALFEDVRRGFEGFPPVPGWLRQFAATYVVVLVVYVSAAVAIIATAMHFSK